MSDLEEVGEDLEISRSDMRKMRIRKILIGIASTVVGFVGFLWAGITFGDFHSNQNIETYPFMVGLASVTALQKSSLKKKRVYLWIPIGAVVGYFLGAAYGWFYMSGTVGYGVADIGKIKQ